jgi:hypothetical protein
MNRRDTEFMVMREIYLSIDLSIYLSIYLSMNAMPAHRKRERWEEGTDRWSNVKPRN